MEFKSLTRDEKLKFIDHIRDKNIETNGDSFENTLNELISPPSGHPINGIKNYYPEDENIKHYYDNGVWEITGPLFTIKFSPIHIWCKITIKTPQYEVRTVKDGFFSTTEKKFFTENKYDFCNFDFFPTKFDEDNELIENPDTIFFNDLNLDTFSVLREEYLRLVENFMSTWILLIKKEYKDFESLKSLISSTVNKIDKNRNGSIDLIEEIDDEILNLLKTHQKQIIEFDVNFIQKIVRVDNFLKTKKENIKLIFNEIKNSSLETELENNFGLLSNEIHVYKLMIFHSLNMISSIVDGDLVTYYEIHEQFDKLNIFNSNWENEVSEKLKNISNGLNNLLNSIDKMNNNIVNGFKKLTYVTEKSNQNLMKQLEKIDSSVISTNFLQLIQTYQMYKMNKS